MHGHFKGSAFGRNLCFIGAKARNDVKLTIGYLAA